MTLSFPEEAILRCLIEAGWLANGLQISALGYSRTRLAQAMRSLEAGGYITCDTRAGLATITDAGRRRAIEEP